MKGAARFADRRLAVTGTVLGVAIAATVLPLGTHFADTRNWAGIGATLGGLVALMAAGDVWCEAGRQRMTGKCSIRRLLGAPAGLLVAAAVLGGPFWLIAGPGRTWHSVALAAALLAYAIVLACVWRVVYLARRRLYWNKYGYSPEARRAQARAESLWPRR